MEGGGVRVTNDDIYSLVAWLESESLEAHNKVGCGSPYQRDYIEAAAVEKTYNKVLSHIRDGNKNARPHVAHKV